LKKGKTTMALQPGVFNVTDPTWNIKTGNPPGTNRDNLQAMVQSLLDTTGPTGGNGGTIEFPSVGTFQFSGNPIVIGIDKSNNTQPFSIIIQGDGQGEEGKPLIQKTDDGDLFQVNNSISGDDHVGGITFRDLMIGYAAVETIGAAIHVVNGENVRVFRCVFIDCPQAVYFEESGHGAMVDCDVVYPPIGGTAVVGTALTLGNPTSDNAAIETYVAGCVFNGNSSPTGSIGIQVNNVEHARITSTRIESFNQGIVVTPGGSVHNVRRVFFRNVSVFAGSSSASVGQAVLIQPTDGTWVAQVTFAECEFDAPDAGTSYQGGGVVIDPINGSDGGGIIDQVRFVDCHVCKWPGPGLLILGGNSDTAAASNIEVAGGYYSVNGGNPATGLPSAGIAIIGGTAGPSGIRITGAACNNSVYDILSSDSAGFLTAVQDYGISIATAQDVFARACDLRGNLTKALTVSGTITNLQVSECAAYNDQATALSTSAPSGTFSGITFGYYGPVAFYASGGTEVTVEIDGVGTGLPSGGFTLGPGETAAFALGGGGHLPTTFFMVGK
jgi:hypothetical protein